MQRFWSKVAISNPNDCWEWTAHKLKKGYGWFRIAGSSSSAHRVAAFLSGMLVSLQSKDHVLHKCDNPPCCNPAHLFVGNNAINVADRVSKGRSAHVRQYGERNGMAKLTGDDVQFIKRLVSMNLSQSEIARAYNVKQPAISRIVSGKRWGVFS